MQYSDIFMPYSEDSKRKLTGHRVGAGHEVEGDGVGGVRDGVLQTPLWDFVEAVCGSGHVFIHPIKKGVCTHWLLRLPEFEAALWALAVFSSVLGILGVTRERCCKKTMGDLNRDIFAYVHQWLAFISVPKTSHRMSLTYNAAVSALQGGGGARDGSVSTVSGAHVTRGSGG